MAITSKNIRDIRTGLNDVGIECHFVNGKLVLKWGDIALYEVHRRIINVFDRVVSGYLFCIEGSKDNTCVIDLEG